MDQPKSRARPDKQRELFEPPSDGPTWSELPHEVQRAVTALVARMLRQRGQETSRAAEVEHD